MQGGAPRAGARPTRQMVHRRPARVPGGMWLEAGFVRLTMDELLGSADAADEQEAQQLLVVVVVGGALMDVVAGPSAERQHA
jgi:hypothetical protein